MRTCPATVWICLQPGTAYLQVLKKLLLLYVFEDPHTSVETPDYLSAVSVRCLHILVLMVSCCFGIYQCPSNIHERDTVRYAGGGEACSEVGSWPKVRCSIKGRQRRQLRVKPSSVRAGAQLSLYFACQILQHVH